MDRDQATVEPYEGRLPKLAPTVFVHASCVVIGDVEIGEEASLWPQVTLRGDEGRIVIGAGTNIQDGTTVHMTGGLSNTLVGERVTVGHNCILHGCQIADGALIGMGAIVLDNAQVGEGAFVGAGALVTQNVEIPPGTLALGSPARVVRELKPQERQYVQVAWRHYVEQAAKYRALGRS